MRRCDLGVRSVRRDQHDGGPGVVVLAATPIGDAADASPRLRAELAGADVIAAEDTRRLRRLLDRLDVIAPARIVSYFEGNEAARTPELLAALAEGARVVVVTDAGMPSVSDPGYRLVAAAVEQGIAVTAVPGPSAVLTALAVSGLPVDRFCFEGFLPRKGGRADAPAGRAGRRAADHGLLRGPAPHRGDAWRRWPRCSAPDRPAAVCRELTKTYEEIRPRTAGRAGRLGRRHGSAARSPWWSPARRSCATDLAGAVGQVLALTAAGASSSRPSPRSPRRTGLAKNLLYEPPGASQSRRRRPERGDGGRRAASPGRAGELPARPSRCPARWSTPTATSTSPREHSGLDPADAIDRAAEVGVTRIVQIGCDVAGLALGRRPRPSAGRRRRRGRHPPQRRRPAAARTCRDALAAIEPLAAHPRVRAVGETGLDYFRTRDRGRASDGSGRRSPRTSRWPRRTTRRWSSTTATPTPTSSTCWTPRACRTGS